MFAAPTPLLVLASALHPREAALPALYQPEPTAIERASWTAAQRRGSYAWEPEAVLAIGGHFVNGDYDTFNGEDPEEDTTYSIDFILYNWEAERGMGLEFGLMYGTYSVPASAVGLGASDDEVDVYRALLGLRLADRGSDDPIYVPYFRGGLMYRKDDGTKSGVDVGATAGSDGDGFGWYLGGGIDFRLGSHVALTPSVMFTNVAAFNAEDWIYGLLLSIGF